MLKEMKEELKERDEKIREELRWRDNYLEDEIKKIQHLSSNPQVEMRNGEKNWQKDTEL